MRERALAAPCLTIIGLMSAQPAAADITRDICFHILDQVEIVAGEDKCDVIVGVTLIQSQSGPYVIELDAVGNLLCTALEAKYLTEYAPIYGAMTFDPIVPTRFRLNDIGPDAAACGIAAE
ncbi:hypothetical protein [uncultured Thiohalocapsa sp.]|uniref:hypothetical protein n=1 Tax=uncultured Thiohalocapsa sp. TaxID=768990 RepID=UPI0025DD4746|nr:hypothetical protein [uncultured Thiohalocapsa sp.]